MCPRLAEDSVCRPDRGLLSRKADLGPGEFDQAPQMPDEDLPVTRLRDEVYGTPVERHAFVGIQGFLRGEKALVVMVARYDLVGQEHDGHVDTMLAQLSQ